MLWNDKSNKKNITIDIHSECLGWSHWFYKELHFFINVDENINWIQLCCKCGTTITKINNHLLVVVESNYSHIYEILHHNYHVLHFASLTITDWTNWTINSYNRVKWTVCIISARDDFTFNYLQIASRSYWILSHIGFGYFKICTFLLLRHSLHNFISSRAKVINFKILKPDSVSYYQSSIVSFINLPKFRFIFYYN